MLALLTIARTLVWLAIALQLFLLIPIIEWRHAAPTAGQVLILGIKLVVIAACWALAVWLGRVAARARATSA